MKTLTALVCLFALTLIGCASAGRGPAKVDDRIRVILDTDIGNDIDDTWALAMLLRSPRFDLRLVTTTDGQPEYRARLVAKLLTIAGRNEIPIGLGPDAGKPTGKEKESRWLGNYQLSEYKGLVLCDGVGEMIRTIKSSRRPVTVISIGPLQTLAAALDRDPSIARNVNWVGMQGSVFKGYNGSDKPGPEFNVKLAIPAARRVFAAPWRTAAITPLDTCGLPGVSLSGAQYHQIQRSDDPLLRAIIDSYAAWSGAADRNQHNASTTLYDTVAVYLADPANRGLLQLQTHPIAVTNDGMTVVKDGARPMNVATGWNDLAAYRDYLVHVLTEQPRALEH